MLDLLLGILFFNCILILFKLFDKYKADNFQAIIINYVVAGGLGLSVFLRHEPISVNTILGYDWFYYAILIGCFFIGVFKLLADGAQKVGLAISTVANKMSVILPVIASFILYGDSITGLKIIGLILALIGVVLSASEKGKLSFDKKYLWLILIIFFGQGIADILFNYAQSQYVDPTQAPLFISTIFLSAFVVGSLVLTIRVLQKKEKLRIKNIGWGIALGVPNYLTVYYFFRALDSGMWESSEAYPLLNMGVIVLSALTGFLLFKEKFSLSNWLGIGLCVIAICFISLERFIHLLF